ncbi:hypothetical protein SAMN02799624_05222 [Paenibacillus sp. UNC496MF]|uniref:hypothetical protein n=1 Tax=Paenibacillus sp. UNC496MF TaxID=1502753 RepID=UPI0008E11957|nr:hypothetical protein [Paenibacillus sp. UNC496MF]SFJ62377.1 hypothetical protein SAMN02799624_05222 [Paenibacillus sp. UNC496MF]
MKNLYSLAEHQSKKLVAGSMSEYVCSVPKLTQESVNKLSESAKGKNRKLIVQMEAIHVGRTANYTYYTKEGLSEGLASWTTPYNKPVLTHHDDYHGEPIGRILKAEFHDMTKSGRAGLVFTVEITDPTAIEKVLDGRYQTVSIGATTDKVTCNICGTDRTQEWCDHYPGEEHDGQTAHFIIGTTFGREVSYVNVPADQNAGNTSVTVVEGDETQTPSSSQESASMEIFQIAEGLFQNIRQPDVNLYHQLNENVRQLITGLVTAEGSVRSMDPEPETNPNPQVPTQEGQQPPAAPAPENQPATPVQEGQESPAAPPAPAAEPPAAPVQEGDNTPTAPTPEPPASQTTPVQEGEVVTLRGQVTEMQRTITNLVIENQKLVGRATTAEQESQRVLAENADLQAQLHRHLAEKVVDMKRTLNKPDVVGVDRAEAVTAHAARTKESLENTLSDLVAEMKNQRPAPGSVTNPGYSGEEGEDGNKSYTVEEAEGIIAGMFSSKKKKR